MRTTIVVGMQLFNMNSSSLTLVCRTRQFISKQILRNIVVFERAVLLARHPHHVHDIIAELHCIVASMLHLGDWSLFHRLLVLKRCAHDLSFRLCHALIHRCAVLLDHLTIEYGNRRGYLASHDPVAQAVRACDDVLYLMVSSERQFYSDKLRPGLVSFIMQDCCGSEQSSSPSTIRSAVDDDELSGLETDDSESESVSIIKCDESNCGHIDWQSAGSEHDFGRHVISWRWMTSNIVFEYEQYASDSDESSRSSSIVQDYSDSDSFDWQSAGCEQDSGRHIIRWRWMTSNIVFNYEQYASVSYESSSSTVHDYSDTDSLGDSRSLSPAAKRSCY
jgi:hypothetical protein